jgi:hypothetical protein
METDTYLREVNLVSIAASLVAIRSGNNIIMRAVYINNSILMITFASYSTQKLGS